MFNTIQPYQYAALRLPSDSIKIEQMAPNTVINLGKYGSFNTSNIIGRPYHLTFEILERQEATEERKLRVVSAAELHAAALIEEAETDDTATPVDFDEYGMPTNGKSNVYIFDNPDNQKLTFQEIEALKQDEMGSSKDIIAKIMESHSALDQKTAFSLAKYTLRKQKKYMKRFCVLPLDAVTLADWMMAERDFAKVLELRNETLGLIGSWANIHSSGKDTAAIPEISPSSRYLIVDDTGGLAIAGLAERMGILHPSMILSTKDRQSDEVADIPDEAGAQGATPSRRQTHVYNPEMASSNTITMVHTNQQPNLALLRYFNYDQNNPLPGHPLQTHLKTLSWLQLLSPEEDATCVEPEQISPEDLAALKSSKRSAYYRKRRRWGRARGIVDETRAGGFNGLVIVSFTNPVSILHHLVPLLAGGSQVVIYTPHVEPLIEVSDIYSTARRTAFINATPEERNIPSKDFPVDPTLLLGPIVQTARMRRWQVLPGRTHPLMMGRGGAEGYVLSATRVIPAEGRVEARGRPPRSKRKAAVDLDSIDSDEEDDVPEDGGNKRAKVEGQNGDHDNGELVETGSDVDMAEVRIQTSTRVTTKAFTTQI